MIAGTTDPLETADARDMVAEARDTLMACSAAFCAIADMQGRMGSHVGLEALCDLMDRASLRGARILGGVLEAGAPRA